MPRFPLLVAVVAGAAALAAGAGRAATQEASPAASPAAAQDLVAGYAAALNAHDPDRVAALYAEDAVVAQAVRDGNVFEGRQEIRGWVAANLAGIPDLTVTTESVVAEGDRVAWAWVYRGAYAGRYPDLPAGRGQPIELRGVSLLELRDGRIGRETVYFDNYDFLVQVGALPGTGTPEAGTPAPQRAAMSELGRRRAARASRKRGSPPPGGSPPASRRAWRSAGAA